jgi:hypothetical protein
MNWKKMWPSSKVKMAAEFKMAEKIFFKKTFLHNSKFNMLDILQKKLGVTESYGKMERDLTPFSVASR